MTLSKFSILLGVALAIFHLWALLKPAGFSEAIKKFPRSEMWGYALMAIGAGWFLFNVNREAIAEFAAYKTHLLIGFGSVAVLACLFVPDYLAVRGLCITILMLASYSLSLTRWADSSWRLLLVIGAYVWIVISMWWMISPWRMRDFLNWLTARPERLRNFAIVRLVFAVALIVLGATAFRS
jgi:hypothetical protein